MSTGALSAPWWFPACPSAKLPSETLSTLPGPEILDRHQALHSVAKTAGGVFNWDNNHHPYLSIQGVLFNFSPDQLASQSACSFDELKEQYGKSHPVRDLLP